MPDAFPVVEVDWNQDGSFTDISSRVYALDIDRGIDPGKHFANDDVATFICDNDDEELSPENTASSLYPYTSQPNRVIRCTIQGVVQFTGLIEDIKPDIFKYGEQKAKLICTGLKKLLDQGEYYPRVYQDRRIDEIAALMVQELPIVIPGLSQGGVVGQFVIGTDTIGTLADLAILQKGYLSFPYAGDNLHGRDADMSDRFFYEPGGNKQLKVTTRWEFLKDLIEAEGGLLYFGADGRLVVRNRYWLAADQTAISYTINNDMQGGQYQTPLNISEFYNRITIKYQPRAEAAAKTTVWTNKEAYTVRVGGPEEIEVIFDNETSATNLAVVSSSVLSTASIAVTFELLRVSAQRARFRLTHANAAAQTLAAGALSIEGNVLSINSGIADKRDDASIISGGEKGLQKTIRGIATHAEAVDLADFLLQWHANNAARMKNVTLTALNPASADRVLNTDIGTRVRVVEDQSSNDGEYHVMGRKVSYSAGKATQVNVTLALQKASNTQLARYGKQFVSADVSLRESGGADKLAMSFQSGRAGSVGHVRLWLRTVGSPAGAMTLTIEPDSSGDPSGTPVTNGTAGTVDEDDTTVITGGYQWVTFTFSTPPSLSASTTYWLVLSTDRAAHASNYIEWGVDDVRQGLHDILVDAYGFNDSADLGASFTGNNDLTDQGSTVSQLAPQTMPALAAPYDSQGILGRAAQFSGANDYLDIADNAAFSLTSNLAILTWVKPEEVAGTQQAIVTKWDAAAGNRSYELQMDGSNEFKLFASPDGTALRAVTSSTFGAAKLNRWHMVYTYHELDTEMGMSVNNGVVDTNVTGITTIFDNTADFSIGARGDSTVDFQGQVALVFVFNTKLTTAQLDFLWNNGKGRQVLDALGYLNGEMKSEASSTWSAEVADAAFEVHLA